MSTTASRLEVDAPRGKPALEPSVFAKAADVAQSVDQAKFSSQHALAEVASGPLLMQETLSVLDAIRDVPFDKICNDGSKITPRNLLGKLARCTLTPIKEIYLPLMTWGLPTNHLMVRRVLWASAFGGGCTLTSIEAMHLPLLTCKHPTTDSKRGAVCVGGWVGGVGGGGGWGCVRAWVRARGCVRCACVRACGSCLSCTGGACQGNALHPRVRQGVGRAGGCPRYQGDALVLPALT
jgi:hypothetical protein